jgi:hypothetical protein
MSVAARQARLIAEAMNEPGSAAPASEMVKEIVTILAKDKQQSTIEAARQIVEYVESERARAWDETERDRMVKEHAAAVAEAQAHRTRADESSMALSDLQSRHEALQADLAAARADLASRSTIPMLLREHMPESSPPAVDLQPVIARIDGLLGQLGKPEPPAATAAKEFRVTVLARDGNGAIERIKYTERQSE